MAARHLLKQTGLPEPMLAQIWNLSDIDKDGRLTQEEFVLAMHLTDTARSGNKARHYLLLDSLSKLLVILLTLDMAIDLKVFNSQVTS